ncbi:NUDIX domain-containing protein [Halanaerobiaceae bacterium Z-7014]|uniref:NUDIX domain-containing protein n=1 Tax=Halonatronomonas betaini TaxID=2778430 RepID=A0A931F8U5_9FIRM|nr:NUDIX domain-containing protein [Halonatronomonas betaini]MBF8436888.1 NUDIX domain-containing protein [Halonatronomonas betaini]
MDNDCGFTKENDWFRYRAAAIIIEDDCLLFAKNEVDDYYYSIGGAVHIGEKAEDAVRREVLEETGVPYEIDRLAFIHENFFDGTGSFEGYKCHEIAFYFLMKSKGSQKLKSNSYSSLGIKEYMHWIPIDNLENYKAFPTFFKDKIDTFDSRGVEHIITNDY